MSQSMLSFQTAKDQVILETLNTSSIAVLLPTYCERENIGNLIREIQDLNLAVNVIVVDDSSSDGTSDIVKELAEEYDNITLISRPGKLGLGTAITDGFRCALKLNETPAYIITMDSDYSHNPQDISRLLEYAKKGNDVVIGSRYVEGGKARNWPLKRRLISRFANVIANIIIGRRTRDCTSGFRCYSRIYIENVLRNLHSTTYEIQIETLRQAHINKFNVEEVPIIFVNRKKGKSKLSSAEFMGFVTYVAKATFSNILLFLRQFRINR
jgi:dolichol-phosphate mannosyltransferase